jgi:peptidyl-prolyl cis-trans isomerase C
MLHRTHSYFVGSNLARALVFIGSIALLGCSQQEEQQTLQDKVKSSANPGAIIASIDGTQITVEEFQDRINSQSPYVRARYTSPEQKKEFLDNLIRFEVLAQEAKKRGFDKDFDVIRTMKQVMVQKLMKDRLAEGIRPEDITDEEMKAYYDSHLSEFHKPKQVRVAAIILNDAKLAETVAKEALGEKGATNRGFRELIAQHSVDEASKKQSGDLRFFTEDNTELPKAVVESAFTLQKTGDVAGPIDAGDGRFFIIKQTGHRKAIEETFENVKRQIQNRIYRDKRTQAQKDFVANLRANADIQIYEDALNKVSIEEGTPGEEPPMPTPSETPNPPDQELNP